MRQALKFALATQHKHARPVLGTRSPAGGKTSRNRYSSRILSSQFNSYICECCHTPKCRHDHRLKQHPRWPVDQLPDATVGWATPSGRQYTSDPTRYPSEGATTGTRRLPLSRAR